MWTLIFLVIILFLIGVAIRVLVKPPVESELPYKLETCLFNKSELAFFHDLKKVVPADHHIFSKVRIIDFIKPTSRGWKWRNKVWAKHVDFLICDKYLKPVLAIELDGKSHRNSRRLVRDEFVNRLFKKVGLRFERVAVGDNFADTIESVFDKK